MENIKTLHIVGYKNSGKTTLISNWVRELKATDCKVAVIKHHGHGAKLAMPDAKKDSMKYLEHGADTSIVAGSGFTQHMIQQELDFLDLKKLAAEQHPDVIFVEGYKEEAGYKVVLVRDEADWESLQHLENIVLVIGLKGAISYPQIATREDGLALKAWLQSWMQMN